MNKVGQRWRNDQRGAANPLLISTIVLAVLLAATAGGFIWAYIQYNDWHNNTQPKIEAAAAQAKSQQLDEDTKKFREEEKKPNRVYAGPSDMGSVKFSYPKTWSVYRATADGDTNSLLLYFYPLIVPQVKDGVTPYALRVQVSTTSYDKVLENYQGLIKDNKAIATTLVVGRTDKFKGYEGTRVDGQLTDTVNGSVAIFKVRDKTLQVFVDSQDYMKDFEDTILKTLTFEP